MKTNLGKIHKSIGGVYSVPICIENKWGTPNIRFIRLSEPHHVNHCSVEFYYALYKVCDE